MSTTELRESLTVKERHPSSLLLGGVLLVAVTFTLLSLFALLARIISQSIPVITDRGNSFLTSTIGSEPSKAGIWPGLFGSIGIGIGVLIVAVPLGIAAAVYLEEYSRPTRATRLIVVNIRNLAGVPAVIYGVLGLIIFVGWLKPVTNGGSVIAAALTLSVLVLPVIIITSMESIRAVPSGIRDAGYGVGATRWEVTRDHVIPYAMPGILTGTILSVSRALGESAPLLMLGALTFITFNPTGLDSAYTVLPIQIFSYISNAKQEFKPLAAAAIIVLLAVLLALNATAIFLRNKYQKRW